MRAMLNLSQRAIEITNTMVYIIFIKTEKWILKFNILEMKNKF